MKDVFSGTVGEHYNWFDLQLLSLENLMNCCPENIIFYKDSGVWTIRDEEFNELFKHEDQYVHNLKDFIVRYLLSLPYDERIAYDLAYAKAGY